MPPLRLSETPDSHRQAHAVMSGALGQADDLEVWLARVAGRSALVAIDPRGMLVASPGGIGGGYEALSRWSEFTEIQHVDTAVLCQTADRPPLRIELGNAPDAAAIAEASRLQMTGATVTPRAGQQLPMERSMSPVLLVTSNDVPGHEITAVHGDVFGAVVRARNILSNLGASLRTVAGGEVMGYTRLVIESRNQARERLMEAARAQGANAVIAMRFDSNEMGDVMAEIVAYGTAVTIRTLPAAGV